MEQQTHSPKFIRQRKFFMVLPLLVLPFITLMFWALGGGKTSAANAQVASQKGFNMKLPDAYLKEDKSLDKLSYYEKAASDSVKLKEQMKNDPYYNYPNTSALPEAGSSANEWEHKNSTASHINTSPYTGSAYSDPNETKVYQKLEKLNKILDQPPAVQKQSDTKSSDLDENNTGVSSQDIDRLEQMMTSVSQGDGEDPEMQQLNGMLEKILDIQHPERVKERLREVSEAEQGQVFAVNANSPDDLVSLLDNRSVASDTHFISLSNGFFSFDDFNVSANEPNAIQTVIHETQTLVAGSTVKLRLLQDIYINGTRIPKNNFLFGIASLNGERLNLKINSIRYKNSLFPIELSVYDLDGLEGIYIPGAITRDAAKQSADRAVQGLGITTLDPSLGAQAASAGINAARSLFSKKVKQVKVTVKAGYRILLLDEKQKQYN
ncbi:conjugative transposon protein TraM [Rubrolithibacter danxiaensis]|uniref:conjugative transposon protein TraM n=1 Tax=Rubrolithibacter danxiaensis TaxID=3390805 RepID=UPI003BF870F6